MAPTIITLVTDFGRRDAYVGIMKGVILGLNPDVQLVDLSHEAPPQDVLFGGLVLRSAWRYFPAGTIHLAVVDPGVGSLRRALAAAWGEHFFVGPDNGIFPLVFADQKPHQMVSIENPRYFLPQVSATFHGRDIFAPVAAHLSLGVPLASFGPSLVDPVCFNLPEPTFKAAEVEGQIMYQDHFGNLISNIPLERLQTWLAGRSAHCRIRGWTIRAWSETYSEVAPGALLALVGSLGFLEIACREGSAAQVLGAGVGDRLELRTGD